MSRAVLLVLVAMAGCQAPDDWTVLSVDTVKVEDLLPSSRKIPDLTALVRQKIHDVFDEFAPSEDVYRAMRDIEPSLEHVSDFKLRMLIHLLRLPPQSPNSTVTLRHHGNIYKAWCSEGRVHFTDPDMSEEFANKEQPCGQLVRQWVGKTVSNWPEGHPPTAKANGWTVGVTAHPQLGTLQFLANKHREVYSEFYFIWSVEPDKQ